MAGEAETPQATAADRAAFNARGLSVSQRALAGARNLRDRRASKLRAAGAPDAQIARILASADERITGLEKIVARNRHYVARDRVGAARPLVMAPARTTPRPRGAGRPRRARTATRSSARSGDSGDSSEGGEPEPPPAAALRLWRHPRWGPCNPRLTRLLTAAAREVAR